MIDPRKIPPEPGPSPALARGLLALGTAMTSFGAPPGHIHEGRHPDLPREVRPGQRYPVRRRMATYAEHPIHDRILHADPSEAHDLAELVDDVYDSLASLPEIDEP